MVDKKVVLVRFGNSSRGVSFSSECVCVCGCVCVCVCVCVFILLY